MPLAIMLAKVAIGKIVSEVLKRTDVPVENSKVPGIVKKVEASVEDQMGGQNLAVVDVKSSMYSKIEWIQIVSFIALIGSTFNLFSLDAKEQTALVTGLGLLTTLVTYVMRRWFTTSITKSSVDRAIAKGSNQHV